MNHRILFLSKWIAVIAMIIVMASCNRKFDVPPTNADPDIKVTITIAQLKERYEAIGVFKRIEDDQVISGVVVADDRSGNFYKQIIIQDETGGIPVLLDANNVYTMYPVGRRVYIRLKGMMLGDYGGTIQIGIDSSRSDDGRFLNLDGIPQPKFDDYIEKGSFNNPVIPKIIKPEEITTNIKNPLLSTLVQIDNSEFQLADLGKTYADPDKSVSAVNFTIRNCSNRGVVLRNSSYARFAGLQVPRGNGSLIGVPSIFNGVVQMFIRDTADVKFTGIRCSDKPVTVKTIAEIVQYATGDSIIPSATALEGILVSDSKNEAAGNYRFQDASGGIQIRFVNAAANPTGVLGDKYQVNVSGLKLSQFNGGLQISGVSAPTKTGTGTIIPRATTVAAISTNMRPWESTVVRLTDVTISQGSSNFAGVNYTIKDATGEITTFIRNTAGIIMPIKADSIVGYVSVFQQTAGDNPTAQITLRTQADVYGGVGGAFAAVYDFALVTNATGTTDPTTPPVVQNLTFSNFIAVGVGANSSGSGRFSFDTWPTGALNASDNFTGTIDLNKYYEVTITPTPGKLFDLNKITFTLQRSGQGVRQASIRSSMDNYANNLPASINTANTNLSVVATNIFQVTDGATTAQDGCTITLSTSYTNLNAPVKFRFYGFNAESAGGTFSIDNVKFEGTLK